MSYLPKNIIAARMIDLGRNRVIELEQRQSSYCFFLPENEEIQLDSGRLTFRLDFGPKGLDKNGDPTLDSQLKKVLNYLKFLLTIPQKNSMMKLKSIFTSLDINHSMHYLRLKLQKLQLIQ